MNDSEGFGLSDLYGPALRAPNQDEPLQGAQHKGVIGSPLPIGVGSPSPLSQASGDSHDSQRPGADPPPRRALAADPASPLELPSGLQRTLSALRSTLPWVQRILPLLDGNIGTAVSNAVSHILTTRQQAPPTPVNLEPLLEPLAHSLADLKTQHRDLRNQFLDQNTSLKRVEDKLEMVREATDRNTLEQQELLEDLKAVGNKVNAFALIALALLAVSVALNVILYLHINHMIK